MVKIVPFTEARSHLTELLVGLENRHEHVLITRNGRPSAVMLSADEYEALEETLEILQDKDLTDTLQRSDRDVKSETSDASVRSAARCVSSGSDFLTREARSNFDDLPQNLQVPVENVLTDIEADPYSSGKELLGHLKGIWSARVGNYRILYAIEGSRRSPRVIILAIDNWGVVYRQRRNRDFGL